jgi:hypothetical protein
MECQIILRKNCDQTKHLQNSNEDTHMYRAWETLCTVWEPSNCHTFHGTPSTFETLHPNIHAACEYDVCTREDY